MITLNVIHRIYRIKYGDGTGTCFVIDEGGHKYLITAKHIVKNIKNPDTIKIENDNGWIDVKVNLIGHATGSIDISVLTGDLSFSSNDPLFVRKGPLALSQDVWFVGFPNTRIQPHKTSPSFLELNRNFPLPMLRQGIVSWMHDDFIWIDAHGNIGSSGSPVVFKPNGSDLCFVIAVISKRTEEIKPVYETELQAKNDDSIGIAPIGYYRENSGVITAYSIKHALNLINSKPF
ncbi:hypothetical protein C6501_07835 [Candidatus Poribacteria bacterium]|nr:MAG: hypothetical protein C6501_07835 [Candidatus Poribacteria bacterium]